MSDLLKNLSPDTGMAFLYVQHLSPDHKSMLSSLLGKTTSMKVKEAGNKEKILPNNIYVIPPDKEMNILDGHITLNARPDRPRVNLPIDILFSSLADTHNENLIGIILSASAKDGTRGMKAIKHVGGLTIAQDDTAKFGSMPLSAIAAGVVDFVLSPKKIGQEISRLSKHPFIKPNGTKGAKGEEIDDTNSFLKTILGQLNKVHETLYDGEQLMRYLKEQRDELPTVIFLDLNMPRKNGFICLEEIKSDNNLKQIRVIIYSTSYETSVDDLLCKKVASFYICKPAEFNDLQKVIAYSLNLISNEKSIQPPKEKFLLSNIKSKLT